MREARPIGTEHWPSWLLLLENIFVIIVIQRCLPWLVVVKIVFNISSLRDEREFFAICYQSFVPTGQWGLNLLTSYKIVYSITSCLPCGCRRQLILVEIVCVGWSPSRRDGILAIVIITSWKYICPYRHPNSLPIFWSYGTRRLKPAYKLQNCLFDYFLSALWVP